MNKYSDFTDLNIGSSNLTLIVRGTLIESNMHSSIAEKHKKVMEGQIYEVSQFQVRQNNRRYKLTPHKYIIQVTRETTIVVVDKKMPQIPINNFWIKKYKELLLLTGTKSELPDVIGKIRIIQGTDLRNSQYNTKILVGLQLSRNTIVRLIIWDDQASKFRETLGIKDRKHSTMLVTSVNPNKYQATSVLFDPDVIKLLGRSANDVLNENIQVGGDATNTNIPECLKKIIGRTCKFQIKITSFNFETSRQTITVSRIVEDNVDLKTKPVEDNLNRDNDEGKIEATSPDDQVVFNGEIKNKRPRH
ncbi:unnamed protein product [Thlaspi arvense]|uniref:DUF223 domain-containing protein n=1 Tax=Thlaspi arvense TaxID=13288 RepID=A0AAU9RRG7_THLAR|nr:unnamed protein product [Thlaspi arvense]